MFWKLSCHHQMKGGVFFTEMEGSGNKRRASQSPMLRKCQCFNCYLLIKKKTAIEENPRERERDDLKIKQPVRVKMLLCTISSSIA